MNRAIREVLSPNSNARPASADIELVVVHFTGMETAEAALRELTQLGSGVSAHWMIDEDGTIYRLVPEERRAWHAGLGSWHHWHDVNAVSIGIELVNPGHDHGYRPFPDLQIEALEDLLADTFKCHGLRPCDLIGHSDVAPERKQDPGELFPWERLARAGFSIWPDDVSEYPDGGLGVMDDAEDFIGDEESRTEFGLDSISLRESVSELQENLRAIGYGIETNGVFGTQTEAVVAAFQRRFRPGTVDGYADSETRALIQAVAQMSR